MEGKLENELGFDFKTGNMNFNLKKTDSHVCSKINNFLSGMFVWNKYKSFYIVYFICVLFITTRCSHPLHNHILTHPLYLIHLFSYLKLHCFIISNNFLCYTRNIKRFLCVCCRLALRMLLN